MSKKDDPFTSFVLGTVDFIGLLCGHKKRGRPKGSGRVQKIKTILKSTHEFNDVKYRPPINKP